MKSIAHLTKQTHGVSFFFYKLKRKPHNDFRLPTTTVFFFERNRTALYCLGPHAISNWYILVANQISSFTTKKSNRLLIINIYKINRKGNFFTWILKQLSLTKKKQK